MKYSTVLSLALAAVASAQSISDIPQCALTCFLGPLQSDGCKGLTDFKCHCSNPDLIPQVTPCVAKACPADVAQEVQEKAVALCKANGVDITIPGTGSSTEAPAETGSSPPIVSESVSAYPTGGAPTMSTYPAPSGNGSSPTAYPPPPPTGAASKATFGGAVAVAAGVAALAGL